MENQSPYINRLMIRNAKMFFGRHLLLKRCYAALANRQSVSILGPRRIGKSSLLWCSSLPQIQARYSFDLKCHIFVFLDLHDYLDRTTEDFFHSVSREIIAQSPEELALDVSMHSRGADAFSSVLSQVIRKDYFPVLLLDSFDKVTQNEHFGPDFFGFLRAQASRGRVSYVTASFAPLYEVCHSSIKGSPFFNIFYDYKLEALTYQEARELIAEPSKAAGTPFSEEEVKAVLQLAGRHPFFIQRVCHILFEEKGPQGKEKIDMRSLARLAYNELRPHFQDSWEQLTPAEQFQLRQEAQQKDGKTRKLPELSESSLFRHFVASLYGTELVQVGSFQISAKELEKLLGKINKQNELGRSSLQHMQTVAQRLAQNPSPSDAERGIVIREVLREAFERLRAHGTRSDSAAEWRFYNILYYQYFGNNHHITNEQIAARLSLGSVRQYYRERTEAVEALLDVLSDMERSVIVQR